MSEQPCCWVKILLPSVKMSPVGDHHAPIPSSWLCLTHRLPPALPRGKGQWNREERIQRETAGTLALPSSILGTPCWDSLLGSTLRLLSPRHCSMCWDEMASTAKTLGIVKSTSYLARRDKGDMIFKGKASSVLEGHGCYGKHGTFC